MQMRLHVRMINQAGFDRASQGTGDENHPKFCKEVSGRKVTDLLFHKVLQLLLQCFLSYNDMPLPHYYSLRCWRRSSPISRALLAYCFRIPPTLFDSLPLR